jgi:hypothetical protein
MMETDLHAEASDETYSETINFSDSVEDDLALANLSSKWDSPVASPPPPPPINNTCICKVERNKDSNVLIIVTSITSSLCVTFFFILIWYRFIFKKRLLKWKTNETNFGFGPESI